MWVEPSRAPCALSQAAPPVSQTPALAAHRAGSATKRAVSSLLVTDVSPVPQTAPEAKEMLHGVFMSLHHGDAETGSERLKTCLFLDAVRAGGGFSPWPRSLTDLNSPRDGALPAACSCTHPHPQRRRPEPPSGWCFVVGQAGGWEHPLHWTEWQDGSQRRDQSPWLHGPKLC